MTNSTKIEVLKMGSIGGVKIVIMKILERIILSIGKEYLHVPVSHMQKIKNITMLKKEGITVKKLLKSFHSWETDVPVAGMKINVFYKLTTSTGEAPNTANNRMVLGGSIPVMLFPHLKVANLNTNFYVLIV